MNDAACSQLSLECGEPLAGSAGNGAAFVAFSWPKPLWHPDEITRSEGLAADLAALEQAEKAAGRKLAIRAFQREPSPSMEHVELICTNPRDRSSLHVRELPIAELPAKVAAFLVGGLDAPALEEELLLTCTDGRHDRCCAVHGRALFEALRAEIAARAAPISLLECSHLGGHRLAATCISLPSGRMHGRLRASDASALLDALSIDTALAANYRGRFGVGEREQVAEAAALARLPGARILRLEASGATTVEVDADLDGTRHRLRVDCERAAFTSVPSCAADAVPETRQRWLATSIQAD